MENCFSDGSGGRSAVGGTAAHANLTRGPNDAINCSLISHSYRGLFSEIELSLSASNLCDRDVLSEIDPLAVIYAKGKDGTLQELGRTEVVLNSLNPRIRVYDVDTQFHDLELKMLKVEEQQFLGGATCALSEIITKSNRSLTIDLIRIEDSIAPSHSGKFDQLTVCAEECVSSKTTTELVLSCLDLEYKDVFARNDPFLVISKFLESGISQPICKTEVLKNDMSPAWKPVFLNIQQVGSKDNPLILECFNFNSNGKRDLIGKAEKSLADLEKLHSVGDGVLLYLSTNVGNNHENKVLKSQLFVDKFCESMQNTFLDYLAGGCELNLMVAIDFTASNSNPRLPDSLHYIDPYGLPNAYQKAILDVGEVLQFYNSDKRFPAWGFGARPIDGPVSHCFNLNGSSNYSEVEGIQGIMTAYTSALFNVSLAGPTLFGPVISAASLIASQSLGNIQQKYFVLLIITILYADKGEILESTTGHVASRDIVQFVPFRDVQCGEVSVVQWLVAELPYQFLTYMRVPERFIQGPDHRVKSYI